MVGLGEKIPVATKAPRLRHGRFSLDRDQERPDLGQVEAARIFQAGERLTPRRIEDPAERIAAGEGALVPAIGRMQGVGIVYRRCRPASALKGPVVSGYLRRYLPAASDAEKRQHSSPGKSKEPQVFLLRGAHQNPSGR